MFDIAYPLKETHVINGVEHDIDLSFDNVLRIIDLMNDESIDDQTQIEIALNMLLGFEIECGIYEKDKVFNEIFAEVLEEDENEGPLLDLEGNPMPSENEGGKSNYDLKQDAPYIYASFMSDYGIDLFEQQGKMHWEKFKALLSGLTDSSKFLRVLEIREMKIPTGKGSEEQAAEIRELKKQYALKGDDTNEFEDDPMQEM